MDNKEEKDPYAGVGGAYVIDKETGKRVPDKQVATAPKPEPAPVTSADNEE